MKKLLKISSLSIFAALVVGIFSSTYALPPLAKEIIEYAKKLPDSLNIVAKEEQIVKKFSRQCVTPPLAKACLMAPYLSSSLLEELFTTDIFLGKPLAVAGNDSSNLTDKYVAPEIKMPFLSNWIKRKIKPDSGNENTTNIYAILDGCTSNETKTCLISGDL